jgi:hypothetical protein
MAYTIISQDGKQNLISVEIDGKKHETMVICNDGELDDAVAFFVNSVQNPPKPLQ